MCGECHRSWPLGWGSLPCDETATHVMLYQAVDTQRAELCTTHAQVARRTLTDEPFIMLLLT
ncbi:hypothetical protein ACIO3O_41820 [Streptomyces sp. NPDC087440]|uniref:hypothetical protein n=1 Tax=Streptomyces sp. NPDC087440 TaxID=3365790 RepID=UPI0038114A24